MFFLQVSLYNRGWDNPWECWKSEDLDALRKRMENEKKAFDAGLSVPSRCRIIDGNGVVIAEQDNS